MSKLPVSASMRPNRARSRSPSRMMNAGERLARNASKRSSAECSRRVCAVAFSDRLPAVVSASSSVSSVRASTSGEGSAARRACRSDDFRFLRSRKDMVDPPAVSPMWSASSRATLSRPSGRRGPSLNVLTAGTSRDERLPRAPWPRPSPRSSPSSDPSPSPRPSPSPSPHPTRHRPRTPPSTLRLPRNRRGRALRPVSTWTTTVRFSTTSR
jgi:hypothetical protein